MFQKGTSHESSTYHPRRALCNDCRRTSQQSGRNSSLGREGVRLVRGQLVVKLPKPRVEALIASGDGERFDPRHDGRLMKEWITIDSTSEEEWLPLAREAMEFVASQR